MADTLSINIIKDNTFISVMDPISETEFSKALTSSPHNKAPGPSNIPSELWKYAGKNTKSALHNLFNKCIQEENIPEEWKNATIILIPKPKQWKGNIDITRPITLLETARKILTRILTDRISALCSKHNILRGNNISVLKDTNTTVPIHTINNVMEHAREFKNDLWLTFQDMRKAYDSVGWIPIKMALQRIKMDDRFIQLLSKIHNERHNNIMTEFGPSPTYKVEDGIDQGETYSPILWRIFYDPLLCEIQESHQQEGYTMTHTWEHNINNANKKSLKYTINHLAFVDDTCWIANSENSTKIILDKAYEFFNLVDIEINLDKTEIIHVTNNNTTSEKTELQSIL